MLEKVELDEHVEDEEDERGARGQARPVDEHVDEKLRGHGERDRHAGDGQCCPRLVRAAHRE